MARARTAPAATAPPPSGAQAQHVPFGQFTAATAAGELLPPEAVAAGVPVGGAVTVAAAAAAVAGLLSAFDGFNRKRVRELRSYLVETLPRLYPDRSREDVLRFVRDEVARDREFVRNQRDRLETDMKAAMLLDSPDKRRIRVQQILDREKRWTQMREQAALERSAARTNFLTVKEQSPEGAYWTLGQAREHTPDCIAMAGKFWPWEVLDHMHPQLHHGCQCHLLTKTEAVRLGLMYPDQVPDTQDAIRRAAEIAREYHLIQQAASPEEIRDYIDAIMEAPFHALHAHRAQLRYAKGTHEGGKFLPRGGVGTPILSRGAIERSLRRLIPHRPTTPAERRKVHVGEWKRLAGREVFVPEHRAFEREIAGRVFYSPPGSTEVHERPAGKQSPEIPRGRGEELSAVARDQRAEWRLAAHDQAARALSAQERATAPAEVGAHPKATHSGLLDAGFRTHRQEINPESGSITWHYEHPPSGARATLTYHDHRVSYVGWEPGRVQPVLDPLTRPPSSPQEFLDDVVAVAHDIARKHDREPHIPRARFSESLGDTAGLHDWHGVVAIGPDARSAIRGMAKVREEGRPLNYAEARAVYAAYRTGVHEALHAAAPISQRYYTTNATGRGIEEALTEELSSVEAVDVLRRQGLDDVLRWVKANPADFKVEGGYSHYRHALGQILDRGQVPPEAREDVMRILKFGAEPEQRPDMLAALITGAGERHGQNHEEARAWIDSLFTRAARRTDREDDDLPFAPNIRPDLSDVADTPPAVVNGQEIHVGQWVDVRNRAGRVMAIHPRDEGPFFDVRYGTQYAPTGDAHVHAEEITGVRGKPEGILPGGSEVLIGGEAVQPGDRVSYSNGVGGRTLATVERIIRVQNLDMRQPERGWQIEAHTDDGEPVLLAASRTPEFRKEGPAGKLRQSAAVRVPYPRDMSEWTRWDAELMHVNDLARFRDAQETTSPEKIAALREQIRADGVREPITLDHSVIDGRTYISEGNNRLEAAKAENFTHMPVRVITVARVGEHHGGVRIPPVDAPQYTKPSMIGLPTLAPESPGGTVEPGADEVMPPREPGPGVASPGGERDPLAGLRVYEETVGGSAAMPQISRYLLADTPEGERVGSFNYGVDEHGVHVHGIALAKQHRGRGVAQALLRRKHEETGLPIIHGSFSSPEGVAFGVGMAAAHPEWNKLWLRYENGEPVVWKPGEPVSTYAWEQGWHGEGPEDTFGPVRFDDYRKIPAAINRGLARAGKQSPGGERASGEFHVHARYTDTWESAHPGEPPMSYEAAKALAARQPAGAAVRIGKLSPAGAFQVFEQTEGEGAPGLDDLPGRASSGGERDPFVRYGEVPVEPPKFKTIGPGVYETGDGRITMYRIEGTRPPAWNVEWTTGYAWDVQGTPSISGMSSPLYSNIVDGAASKKDAVALFERSWPETRAAIQQFEGGVGDPGKGLSFEGGAATRPPLSIRIGKSGDIRRFPRQEMVARGADGVEIGRLDYGYDPDRNILALGRIDVHADHRRQGVGKELLRRVRELHPGAEVDPGLLVSAEGKAWWDAVRGSPEQHVDESRTEHFIAADPETRLPLGVTAAGGPDVLPLGDVLPKGEVEKSMRDAFAAIDDVHSISANREIDPIPVASWNDGTTAGGAYYSGRDGALLYPQFIRLNPDSGEVELALVHEWGHYLDQQFIGEGVHYGSVRALMDPEHPLYEVMGALVETPELQQINALRGKDQTFRASDGTEKNLRDFEAYATYLIKPHEAFARAYAQWIALRSGNETLKAQIEPHRGETHAFPGQWSDESFAPVAEAMDKAFEKLGWRPGT